MGRPWTSCAAASCAALRQDSAPRGPRRAFTFTARAAAPDSRIMPGRGGARRCSRRAGRSRWAWWAWRARRCSGSNCWRVANLPRGGAANRGGVEALQMEATSRLHNRRRWRRYRARSHRRSPKTLPPQSGQRSSKQRLKLHSGRTKSDLRGGITSPRTCRGRQRASACVDSRRSRRR